MHLNKEELLMNNTQEFIDGYTDAYYGKDYSENYTGLEKVGYLKGQDKFFEDFYSELKGKGD
jgi:hypothetical protein